MFGQTFYHGHLRKYVVLFGTLFNDLYINRDDNDGDHISSIKIPITYAPKDKLITRNVQDPDLKKPFSLVLPRISFELTSLNYAPTRKLSTVKKGYVKQDSLDNSQLKYTYNPVPYDLNFSLYIAVKNTEDGTRILEQILPFFAPEWTATINLIPELDIKLDIPTTLINVTSEDIYEGNYSERRALVWTLDFTMKGYIFGPIKKSEVVTLANTNFFPTFNLNTDRENVTVYPGQLANGTPTNSANDTINRSLITANSDYGYVVNYESIREE